MTRDEAIKLLELLAHFATLEETKECCELAIEALKQPERKKGRWLSYLKEGLKWKCSECGSRFTTPFHYCPHCGERMECMEVENERQI